MNFLTGWLIEFHIFYLLYTIDVELTVDMKLILGTLVQNNQEPRCKYWATRLFVRSHRSLVH